MSPNLLATLTPTHVLYKLIFGGAIECFDLAMSNGVSMQGGKCNLKAELPDKLTRIQVAITKNEGFIHSIKFEGDSVL